MGIKQYKLSYGNGTWPVVIAVDDEIVSDDLLHEINGSGWDAKERVEGDDLLFAVLRLLYSDVQTRACGNWLTFDQLKN